MPRKTNGLEGNKTPVGVLGEGLALPLAASSAASLPFAAAPAASLPGVEVEAAEAALSSNLRGGHLGVMQSRAAYTLGDWRFFTICGVKTACSSGRPYLRPN